MPKLTDTQLVILSAAARREDGTALPVPKSLKAKGAARTKTLQGLCRKGLLEEKPAMPDAESWREEEDGRRMALIITAAIQLSCQAYKVVYYSLVLHRFEWRRFVSAGGMPSARFRPSSRR